MVVMIISVVLFSFFVVVLLFYFFVCLFVFVLLSSHPALIIFCNIIILTLTDSSNNPNPNPHPYSLAGYLFHRPVAPLSSSRNLPIIPHWDQVLPRYPQEGGAGVKWKGKKKVMMIIIIIIIIIIINWINKNKINKQHQQSWALGDPLPWAPGSSHPL